MKEPVLSIYHQAYETEVYTDVSQDGYGAVLLQRLPEDGKLHLVYFMSKKTMDAERKYASYELEVLAVIEALKKFRIYLLGRTFKIITDYAAFQQTMRKKDLTHRITRLALLLEEYDYIIKHRPTSRLKHFDALSRYPVMTVRAAYDIIQRMKKTQDDDGTIKDFKKRLELETYQDCLLRNGLVFYKYSNGNELIVVMQNKIIRNVHEKGHFAAKKTKEEIKREFLSLIFTLSLRSTPTIWIIWDHSRRSTRAIAIS